MFLNVVSKSGIWLQRFPLQDSSRESPSGNTGFGGAQINTYGDWSTGAQTQQSGDGPPPVDSPSISSIRPLVFNSSTIKETVDRCEGCLMRDFSPRDRFLFAHVVENNLPVDVAANRI